MLDTIYLYFSTKDCKKRHKRTVTCAIGSKSTTHKKKTNASILLFDQIWEIGSLTKFSVATIGMPYAKALPMSFSIKGSHGRIRIGAPTTCNPWATLAFFSKEI